MNNWKDLISSGMLELYVLGNTGPRENSLIEEMALVHEEVRNEIYEIELALENLALKNAVEPDPIVKPFLLSTIDYIERMKKGEVFIPAPLLNENSVEADYSKWLNRADMLLPDDFEDVYAKILYNSKEVTTAIVWIKYMAPQEVHHHEHEKFLILEGTCDIHIEDEIFSLRSGDFKTIPLHKKHHVVVTSSIPCKAVLQRVAA